MVTWWSRGSAVNCLVASGDKRIVHGVVIRLEVELLLHVIPEYVLALFELCLALADDLFFLGCENIVGINELLRLDDHQAFYTRDLNKITLLQPQLVADIFRDHDLPALSQLANGHGLPPDFYCMWLHSHINRLSDDSELSSTAGAIKLLAEQLCAAFFRPHLPALWEVFRGCLGDELGVFCFL